MIVSIESSLIDVFPWNQIQYQKPKLVTAWAMALVSSPWVFFSIFYDRVLYLIYDREEASVNCSDCSILVVLWFRLSLLKDLGSCMLLYTPIWMESRLVIILLKNLWSWMVVYTPNWFEIMLVSRSGCYLRVLSFDVGITYQVRDCIWVRNFGMSTADQFLLTWNPMWLQVLHTYKGNKNADKALIAAEYVGVKIDVPSDFAMGVTNKTPEFLKMNPMGKVWELCWYLNVIRSKLESCLAKQKLLVLLGSGAWDSWGSCIWEQRHRPLW